jgi:hypothetical protein
VAPTFEGDGHPSTGSGPGAVGTVASIADPPDSRNAATPRAVPALQCGSHARPWLSKPSNKSGSLATLSAILRASSRVSGLTAERGPAHPQQ